MKFYVPVKWEVSDVVTVEAPSLKAACKIAAHSFFPMPKEAYVKRTIGVGEELNEKVLLLRTVTVPKEAQKSIFSGKILFENGETETVSNQIVEFLPESLLGNLTAKEIKRKFGLPIPYIANNMCHLKGTII